MHKRQKMRFLFTYILSLCCLLSCQTAEKDYIPTASMGTGSRLSNQKVNAFAEDTQGYIWMGTDRGLNRYDGQNYKHYFANKDDSLSLIANSVTCLLNDRQGRLWVGTTRGLCLWMGEDKFKRIDIDLRYRNVSQLIETHEGRIFINLIEQLAEYVPATDEVRLLIEDFDPDHSYINFCYIDSIGNLRSLTKNTARQFNPKTLELMEQHNLLPQDTALISTEKKSFIDSRRNVWTAIKNHGFTRSTLEEGRWGSHAPVKGLLAGKALSSLSTTDGKRVWISTYENEVYLIDTHSDQVTPINTHDIIQPQQPNATPLSIFADSAGRLWVINNERLTECVYHGGVFRKTDDHTEIHDLAVSITEDDKGTIWIGSNTNRIYWLKRGEKSFSSMDFDVSAMFVAFKITHLPDGRIAIGGAFNNPFCLDTQTGKIERIPLVEDISEYSLTTALTTDKQGHLWIGTLGLGAYRYNPNTKEIRHIEGLVCEEVADIIADDLGNIWITTLDGLSQVDGQSLMVNNYHTEDGIGGDQFASACSVKLTDGDLFLGGTHGLTTVNPSARQRWHPMTIDFDNLKTKGKLARLNTDEGIRLNPDERDFSITFSMPNYSGHGFERFSYQLEGFNDSWVEIGDNREIYLSNVPAGAYTLKVRAREQDSENILAESTMRVEVLPSWWNTWWFWSFVIILITSYLVVLMLYMKNRRRIREILSQATKVDEKAEEVLSKADKQFMDELYALMEAELSNPELNINSLTEKLLMSRSKLNYKIKGLTGETPAAFFKRFKLNKAAELLRSGEHTVSEVSDLTGFSSPTLFSRNFKQQFGVTPREYVSDAPQSQHPA